MRCASAVVVTAVTLVGCGGDDPGQHRILLAKEAYDEAKRQGVDMSRGPCLGIIEEGWVADVAHDPRQPVDDDPANQCPEYRSGDADHFVELDPDGGFIRSG
jgi:hypothetical protein